MRPPTLLEPPTTGDRRWDALLAAAACIALRGTGTEPGWGSPLPEPWFPAEDLRGGMSEAYRQLTVRRTPREFEAFNIFLNVASGPVDLRGGPGRGHPQPDSEAKPSQRMRKFETIHRGAR